jgi:heme oxygenase
LRSEASAFADAGGRACAVAGAREIPPNGSREAETLRDRLRRATGPAHGRLDSAFAGLDLRLRPDYERFLLVNARVVPALEQAMERGGIERVLPDWPGRRRAAALRRDLRRLGLAAPLPTPLPAALESGTAFGQLGIAYALEGSRLGARLLLRAVETSSDAAVRAASTFLSHGTTPNLWRSFLEQLNRHASVGPAAAEAEVGARAVFEAYLAAFRAPAAGGA